MTRGWENQPRRHFWKYDELPYCFRGLPNKPLLAFDGMPIVPLTEYLLNVNKPRIFYKIQVPCDLGLAFYIVTMRIITSGGQLLVSQLSLLASATMIEGGAVTDF